jgi:hypothetical protein
MKKPNSSQQAKTSPSITTVLKVISDEKALVLFNNIVASDNSNDGFISPKKINLSNKQYYSRLSGLLKADLIKRRKGKYTPTMLGKIVYDSQMIIVEALSHHWKLKALDHIETSNSDRPTAEVKRLIDALIDNYRIKDVLMRKSDMEVRKQSP